MPDQGKPSKEPQAERVPAVKRQRRKGKAARQRPEPATQAMKEAPPALSLPNGGGSLPVRSGGRSPKPPSASPRSDLRRLLLGRSAVRKGAPAAAMPRPSQPSAGARADASQARLEEL